MSILTKVKEVYQFQSHEQVLCELIGVVLGLGLGTNIGAAVAAVTIVDGTRVAAEYVSNKITQSTAYPITLVGSTYTIVGGIIGIVVAQVINYLI